MDIVEELRRQADADDRAGTLYAHEIDRRAASEIERLRSYVGSFRREERRADIAERKIDALRAAMRDALSSLGCGEVSHAMIELQRGLNDQLSSFEEIPADEADSRCDVPPLG